MEHCNKHSNGKRRTTFPKIIGIICIVYCSLFVSYNALALQPLSVHRTWNVFRTEQNGKTICYTLALPIEKSGSYRTRGEPYFMVLIPEKSDYNEVIVSSGAIYSKKNVDISILKRRFPMKPKNEKALTYDRNDDIEIARMMQIGAKVYVTGYFQNGTHAVDTYSLLGFTEAFARIKELCK